MNKNRNLILAVLIISRFSINCEDTGTQPSLEQNLLSNGSFEVDQTPSVQGWRFGNAQLASLVKEAPPGGGYWSLGLTADWSPTMGVAYTPVAGVKTGDIVRLSSFIKAVGSSGGGVIALKVGPSIWTTAGKSIASRDTVWTEITLIDTLALAPDDSSWIVLSSFNTEIVRRKGLFDLVRLEKVSR